MFASFEGKILGFLCVENLQIIVLIERYSYAVLTYGVFLV